MKYKENRWFIINDKVEGICHGTIENLEYKPEMIDDINVQNIEEYYKYLISSHREKDKARVEIIKRFIDKENTRVK